MKDANYNKKRQSKAVSFLKKEHAELLKYANQLPDFSGHVRHLLTEDMEKQNDKK